MGDWETEGWGDIETERPCEIASHHFVNFTGQAEGLREREKGRKGKEHGARGMGRRAKGEKQRA